MATSRRNDRRAEWDERELARDVDPEVIDRIAGDNARSLTERDLEEWLRETKLSTDD